MPDFFNNTFWTAFISIGTLGGIAWLTLLLISNNKHKAQNAPGEAVESMGHEWDGIEELNNPLPMWWVGLFYITIVFAVVYLLLYPGLGTWKGLLGWTSVNAHAADVAAANEKYDPIYRDFAQIAIPELAKDESAMQTGGRLFANNCAVCHGSDARGALGFPNLTDNDWLYGGDADQIKHTIASGRAGVMPAWGASLGEDGVADVSQYVLSMAGREADADAAERGATLFSTNCAACHGVEGKGTIALGAPNLTDNVWLYGTSLGRIQETIRNGRNGIMPAHQERLGDDKVHILAAYIYSLSQK